MPINSKEEVKAIFLEALEQPVDDRRAFLDRACGADGELRAEVEAYLSAEGEAGGFLAHPSVTKEFGPDDGTAEAGVTAEAPVTERAGTMIGRYKLLQQIGEGGFGVVFMAEQETPVRRMVALKVIKLGMDTREVVARFEAERQALAMMDHPNIAKVLDGGSTDSGRPYFVMELMRGSPLTEYCDKHKLVAAERVALMAQICRAVQHAHSKSASCREAMK
jgi:hypothetical protein